MALDIITLVLSWGAGSIVQYKPSICWFFDIMCRLRPYPAIHLCSKPGYIYVQIYVQSFGE